jgi:hypothetical protein
VIWTLVPILLLFFFVFALIAFGQYVLMAIGIWFILAFFFQGMVVFGEYLTKRKKLRDLSKKD